jgi:hypothetical protein
MALQRLNSEATLPKVGHNRLDAHLQLKSGRVRPLHAPLVGHPANLDGTLYRTGGLKIPQSRSPFPADCDQRSSMSFEDIG